MQPILLVIETSRLRRTLCLVKEPRLPYIGYYLTELTFVDVKEANRTDRDGCALINVDKMRRLASVLHDIAVCK
ncbi:hypothetical protein SARC_18085, partial [Sphaeroforma arctica JP610]